MSLARKSCTYKRMPWRVCKRLAIVCRISPHLKFLNSQTITFETLVIPLLLWTASHSEHRARLAFSDYKHANVFAGRRKNRRSSSKWNESFRPHLPNLFATACIWIHMSSDGATASAEWTNYSSTDHLITYLIIIVSYWHVPLLVGGLLVDCWHVRRMVPRLDSVDNIIVYNNIERSFSCCNYCRIMDN